MKINKKVQLFFIQLLIIICGFENSSAQPGPPPAVNLNDYMGLYKGITIDSTTDLNKIQILNQFNYQGNSLELHLNLKEIPTAFKEFTHIYSLVLVCGPQLKDLAGLCYLPNLKILQISEYAGTVLFQPDLRLDSLTVLRISQSRTLADIDGIVNMSNIEDLHISICPALTFFPKMKDKNKLRHLHLDNGNGYAYWDSFTDKKSNINIQNLQYLKQLEYLYLGSYSCFKEIPDCLPKSLKILKFMGKGYLTPNDKIELKNLDNLSLYPNLKEFHLFAVLLEKIGGNFQKQSLDILSLHTMFNLTDIAGLFTFKAINTLKITFCPYLEIVKSKHKQCKINMLQFDEVKSLQNIYFLFECKKIHQLEIHDGSPNLFIPDLKRMDNIPNLTLYTSGPGYHLYKKDNLWQVTNKEKKQ